MVEQLTLWRPGRDTKDSTRLMTTSPAVPMNPREHGLGRSTKKDTKILQARVQKAINGCDCLMPANVEGGWMLAGPGIVNVEAE
ncbi:Hypothetical protein SMAX5B_005271 [Scophthalmus maximus]|uniref:Uncharacterized protein n=1 Tax=Scophthalmus maximus TaxID=52904 RepID=A0A2U9CGY4_SCOMX|nr:Hypothetical protein SMAX5B_005271 [Scophthalmus maximus]